MKIVLYGIGVCLLALIIILSISSLLYYSVETYPKKEAQRIEQKESKEQSNRERNLMETIKSVRKFYERQR